MGRQPTYATRLSGQAAVIRAHTCLVRHNERREETVM